MDTNKKNKPVINDIIFGLILVVTGIIFCFEAIALERPKGWLTAPGLFPLVIFSSLGMMGLFLLISALKDQNINYLKNYFSEIKWQPGSLLNLFKNKTVILILIFFIYYNFLCKILPFEISTFIYLFVIFKIFWAKSIRTTFFSALIITFAFSVVFEHVLKVMLPGIAWRDMLFFLSI